MGTIGLTRARHRGHGVGATSRIAMSRRMDGSVGSGKRDVRLRLFLQ
jgi:hypothetical protein